MLKLMLATGLRAAEVVALRPEHLDMRTCKLIVREGKGAKDRVLWFFDDLQDEIGEWLERRPEGPYLFPTRDGNQLSTYGSCRPRSTTPRSPPRRFYTHRVNGELEAALRGFRQEAA